MNQGRNKSKHTKIGVLNAKPSPNLSTIPKDVAIDIINFVKQWGEVQDYENWHERDWERR